MHKEKYGTLLKLSGGVSEFIFGLVVHNYESKYDLYNPTYVSRVIAQ